MGIKRSTLVGKNGRSNFMKHIITLCVVILSSVVGSAGYIEADFFSVEGSGALDASGRDGSFETLERGLVGKIIDSAAVCGDTSDIS